MLSYGINLTTPRHFSTIYELIQSKEVDFCEIMIDNFLHLEPHQIRDELGDIPVSFHIMNSKFIEVDTEGLITLARRIREFISETKPFYVSDHLARFLCDGRYLPRIAELDYSAMERQILDRTMLWQELLGTRLLLENHPSLSSGKRDQADFCKYLLATTSCGMLFDISNAVVADLNRAESRHTWSELASISEHFHIAGYDSTKTEPVLYIDTHDSSVNRETLQYANQIWKHKGKSGGTLVIERDQNLTKEAWNLDKANLEKTLCIKN